MKKHARKLQLNRETLRRLDQELAWIYGGGGDTAESCADPGCGAAPGTETCWISGCPECHTLRGPNCRGADSPPEGGDDAG
ncbi:MAG: hypothetical protein ACJ76Y_14085 [Thermoanaerobaculia bacterium]